MASRVLKQLGEKAFQPLKIGDIWHKPAISAKNFAKLRRQTVAEGRSVRRCLMLFNLYCVIALLCESDNNPNYCCCCCCREWEFDQTSPRAGFQRKPKGHKHDKLAALRCANCCILWFVVSFTTNPVSQTAVPETGVCPGRQDEIQKNLDGMAERIQTYRVIAF